jgi:predicted nucleic acid-binding protein
MFLVVDANIFTSALVARGFTLDLFFSNKLQLIVPDWIFKEIEEHKNEILTKSNISEDEFELFLNLLMTRVEIIPTEEIKEYWDEAMKISPDPDDIQYFALALKYNCAIWSNDSRLKRQSLVKVFNTEELVKLLGQM